MFSSFVFAFKYIRAGTNILHFRLGKIPTIVLRGFLAQLAATTITQQPIKRGGSKTTINRDKD